MRPILLKRRLTLNEEDLLKSLRFILTPTARMLEMDPKTARKNREFELLPSHMVKPHEHRTRVNPVSEFWIIFG